MGINSKYELGDAIRRFHTVEPLKIDLANVVAKRVFEKPVIPAIIPDEWLYLAAIAIVLSGVVFSLGKISIFPVPVIILTAVAFSGYAGLSVKEYNAMARAFGETGKKHGAPQ